MTDDNYLGTGVSKAYAERKAEADGDISDSYGRPVSEEADLSLQSYETAERSYETKDEEKSEPGDLYANFGVSTEDEDSELVEELNKPEAKVIEYKNDESTAKGNIGEVNMAEKLEIQKRSRAVKDVSDRWDGTGIKTTEVKRGSLEDVLDLINSFKKPIKTGATP